MITLGIACPSWLVAVDGWWCRAVDRRLQPILDAKVQAHQGAEDGDRGLPSDGPQRDPTARRVGVGQVRQGSSRRCTFLSHARGRRAPVHFANSRLKRPAARAARCALPKASASQYATGKAMIRTKPTRTAAPAYASARAPRRIRAPLPPRGSTDSGDSRRVAMEIVTMTTVARKTIAARDDLEGDAHAAWLFARSARSGGEVLAGRRRACDAARWRPRCGDEAREQRAIALRESAANGPPPPPAKPPALNPLVRRWRLKTRPITATRIKRTTSAGARTHAFCRTIHRRRWLGSGNRRAWIWPRRSAARSSVRIDADGLWPRCLARSIADATASSRFTPLRGGRAHARHRSRGQPCDGAFTATASRVNRTTSAWPACLWSRRSWPRARPVRRRARSPKAAPPVRRIHATSTCLASFLPSTWGHDRSACRSDADAAAALARIASRYERCARRRRKRARRPLRRQAPTRRGAIGLTRATEVVIASHLWPGAARLASKRRWGDDPALRLHGPPVPDDARLPPHARRRAGTRARDSGRLGARAQLGAARGGAPRRRQAVPRR